MGSYLNIHLNLFPIYVLLLLITLSHGRPSAKVREQRTSALEPTLTANRHQHHQFNYKNKWYQLNNLNPSSSSASSSSYSPYFFPATTSELGGSGDSSSSISSSNINSVSITSKVNNAKYSNSASEAHGIISQPVNSISQSHDDHDQQVNGIPTTTVDTRGTTNTIAERATGSSVSSHHTRKAKTQQMNKNVAPATSPKSPEKRAAEEVLMEVEGEYDIPAFGPVAPSPSNQSNWYVIPNDAGRNTNTPDVIQIIGEGGDGEGILFDGEGEAANYYQVGSHQQLETFRQNILKSLGHLQQEQQAEQDEDAYSNPTNITMDYDDEDSLAKVRRN